MKGGEGVSTSLPPFFVSIGVVGSCLCVSLPLSLFCAGVGG